jgi:hypothetical protein
MKRSGFFALLLVLAPASAFAGDETLHFKDAEVLKVKVQKPEVSYVLAKPDLTPRYELELKESFLPRIEQSVNQKPF